MVCWWGVGGPEGPAYPALVSGVSTCSSVLLVGVADAAVVDRAQADDRGVFDELEVAEGQVALVELTVEKPLARDLADQGLDPPGVGIGHGPGGGFHGIGEHEDRRLLRPRPWAGIAELDLVDGDLLIRFRLGLGRMVEVLDQRRAVV